MHAANHTYRVALWLNGSIAVKTRGSNPSLYHIFLFIFHSVYPVRDTVRVRVIIFGLGIVLVYT